MLIIALAPVCVCHAQKLPPQGEGKISFTKTTIIPDADADTLNYVYGTYLVKGDQVLRDDLANKNDVLPYRRTFEPRSQPSIRPDGFIEAPRLVQIRNQPHPTYIIDLKAGAIKRLYSRLGKLHVVITFDSLRNRASPDELYATAVINKRDTYTMQLLPDTASEVIAGFTCYYAHATADNELMLVKYTREKTTLKSPLNLFVPEHFPYTVLGLEKDDYFGRRFFGRAIYRITEFSQHAIPAHLVAIPEEAPAARDQLQQLLL